MERKIGEIFEHEGEWYQCVEGTGCYKCDFNFNEDTCTAEDPHCTCRTDHKNVVYKKLEKLGNLYKNNGRAYQLYKLPMPVDTASSNLIYQIVRYDIIEIETKQNQEDMKDNKLNLKPFDLQKAREGKPVCTRDGRKARIICFDRKDNIYPIIALVECGKNEDMSLYMKDGRYIISEKENDRDLMMLSEKYEGWINIYIPLNNSYAAWLRSPDVYKTREEAIEMADDTVWATVKIEWLEPYINKKKED